MRGTLTRRRRRGAALFVNLSSIASRRTGLYELDMSIRVDEVEEEVADRGVIDPRQTQRLTNLLDRAREGSNSTSSRRASGCGRAR